MSIKGDIISKALILIGVAAGSYSMSSGNKTSKAEGLATEFADSAIEEMMLSVRWAFALRQVRDIKGSIGEFTKVTDVNGQFITDCLKVAVIVPSNLEWYIDQGCIYFKGAKLDSIFYYSSDILEKLLLGDRQIAKLVPSGFSSLAALSLASSVAFALYSDSIFADGLKKQYLIKLEEMRQTYSLDYNLVNSGNV